MDVRVLAAPGLPGTAAFAPVEELALINPEADRELAVAALGEAIAQADCGLHPDVAEHWVEQVIPAEKDLLDIVIEREVRRRMPKRSKILLTAACTAVLSVAGGAAFVVAQGPVGGEETLVAAFDRMGYTVKGAAAEPAPSPSLVIEPSPKPAVVNEDGSAHEGDGAGGAAPEDAEAVSKDLVTDAPAEADVLDDVEAEAQAGIAAAPEDEASVTAEDAGEPVDTQADETESRESSDPTPTPATSQPSTKPSTEERSESISSGKTGNTVQTPKPTAETRVFKIALNNWTRHHTVFRAWLDGAILAEFRLDPWENRVVNVSVRVPLSAKQLPVKITGAKESAPVGSSRTLLVFDAAAEDRDTTHRPRLTSASRSRLMAVPTDEVVDPTNAREATATRAYGGGFLRVSVIDVVSQPDAGSSDPSEADE